MDARTQGSRSEAHAGPAHASNRHFSIINSHARELFKRWSITCNYKHCSRCILACHVTSLGGQQRSSRARIGFFFHFFVTWPCFCLYKELWETLMCTLRAPNHLSQAKPRRNSYNGACLDSSRNVSEFSSKLWFQVVLGVRRAEPEGQQTTKHSFSLFKPFFLPLIISPIPS